MVKDNLRDIIYNHFNDEEVVIDKIIILLTSIKLRNQLKDIIYNNFNTEVMTLNKIIELFDHGK